MRPPGAAGSNAGVGMATAADLMRAGLAAIGDRGREYDRPAGERSAGRAAAAFNAVTGHAVTETEAWLFLACLKMVRLHSAPGPHDDSAADGAAYVALAGESKKAGGRTARPVEYTIEVTPDAAPGDAVSVKVTEETLLDAALRIADLASAAVRIAAVKRVREWLAKHGLPDESLPAATPAAGKPTGATTDPDRGNPGSPVNPVDLVNTVILSLGRLTPDHRKRARVMLAGYLESVDRTEGAKAAQDAAAAPAPPPPPADPVGAMTREMARLGPEARADEVMRVRRWLAAEDAAAGRADAGAVNPLTALFGRLAIETRHGGPASGVEVAAAARVIDDLWPAANAGRTVDSRVVAVLDRAVEWGLILQEVAIALAAMIPADRRPEVPRGVVRQTGSDFAPSGRLARWVAAAGDAVERILRRRSSGRPG